MSRVPFRRREIDVYPVGEMNSIADNLGSTSALETGAVLIVQISFDYTEYILFDHITTSIVRKGDIHCDETAALQGIDGS